MARHVVAPVSEIAPGTCKIVSVAGRSIGIYNVKDEFFALINRCPHEGAPLCIGPILGRFTAGSAGRISAGAAWRDAALPVAWLGVRHQDRASPGAIRKA